VRPPPPLLTTALLPHPRHKTKARRGPDWNLSRMNSIIKVPSVLAVFPLHDRKELKHLYKVWMKGALSKLTPWAQPYDEIRDYFGEQIGFYFYFLGHYTTWLMALGVFGFLIFVYSESADPQDAITARIFYCFCLSVWMILLMQSWIRKQRTKVRPCCALRGASSLTPNPTARPSSGEWPTSSPASRLGRRLRAR